MSLFEDYEAYLNKYQTVYGAKTVVLYQNGMFFEVYGIDNETEKIGLVKEVADMLNIQLTRRNKAIITNDRKNFLLAGFPLSQLDRYLAILTEENNYVAVVVEQVTPAPNPKRDVTNIISPSTNLKHICHPNANYLASIYIEHEGHKVNLIKPVELMTIGLSVIDVSTGQNIVYEVSNMVDDQNHAIDQTYQFLQTFQPREIIINARQLTINQADLIAYFDIGHCLIHAPSTAVPPDYYKKSFQNTFLGKIFTHTGMLEPIEFINLEKHPTSVISYILLLDFCYQQKETLINQIECPQIWDTKSHLILDNNCINQLNITSSNTQRHSSVFNLLDHTSTAMGKRLLKEKLLLPLCDPQLIEQRYNYLELMRQVIKDVPLKHLENHQQYYQFQLYEPHLKQISDIERLHRKICLGILQPAEFATLHTSYQAARAIINLATAQTLTALVQSDLIAQLDHLIDYYSKILDLNEASKYNINTIAASFFQRGYNSEIDVIQDQITDYETYFQQLTILISQYLTNSDKILVTYQHGEGFGHHLEMTTARFKTFNTKCDQPFNIKTKSKQYLVTKQTFEVINNRAGKTCKITSPEMKIISQLWIQAKEKLLIKVVEVYKQFLTQLYANFHPIMTNLVTSIAYIDMYKSNAKTSLLYNYCRPRFNLSADGPSGMTATHLRHPLIEQLYNQCPYVPQDVRLDQNQSGILLFGINSSGKSSLMKAIGVAIIMAQAGLYVPAEQFSYTPYHCILTRIVGNDNLFKGLSSFAVEMGELRGILKRANQYSLILGDEICHGTETISAVSLVASAVITLSQSGANFLFATHLHQLSQIEQITDLTNVAMYHLKVKFDPQTGDLIYDRRLEQGSGQPIYGLEVAKAMDLDRKFIDLANDIRRAIMDLNSFVPIKKSKYNKDLYLDRCCIPECTHRAAATHHINFQSQADQMGFIDHRHKNHVSNLVPLCTECHQMLHDEAPGHWKYIIRGYQMTSDGLKLDYQKIQNPQTKKIPLKLKGGNSSPLSPLSPNSSP